MPSTLRSGALLVGCGVVGAVAALAVAGAGGWLGGGTTVERVAAPPPDAGSTNPISLPKTPAGGLDASQLYKDRSGGVVTIDVVFADGSVYSGSGFVVDKQRGLILTNSHVITNSGTVSDPNAVKPGQHVYVEQLDGERAEADVVGYDLFDDVGVLKVDPAKMHLQPVPLGHSSSVTVGEPVAAIGSPFGEEGSLSIGVVSQIARQIPTPAGVCFSTAGAIQTDAAINHGNSGGPLFDAAGYVIGINAQIDTDTQSADQGSQGVGFAVPVDAARESLRQILKTGTPKYAWLGVSTIVPVSATLAEQFHLPVSYGALVDKVAKGSAAEIAGLRAGDRTAIYAGEVIHPDGDIIVRLGDQVVHSVEELQLAVAQHPPGANVPIRYYRDGKEQTAHVVLQNRPLVPAGGCPTLR
jgi:S1-C subfamily serine protease